MPTVSIATSGFLGIAKAIAASEGFDGLRFAEFRGVIMTESDASFREKIEREVTDAVIQGLTHSPQSLTTSLSRSDSAEPSPESIVAEGALDEIQDLFLDQGWSDGLPIIPPTLDRVEKFMRFTDRASHDRIGVLRPSRREATAWNVATNGVMAGCRPEYMPVLVAIAEVLADPHFRLEDAGSTPGWEPMVIVSGPLVSRLNFNVGTGVMRIGRQANSSIGRFTRLFMRNVADLRIPPGATDKGTIGMNFNVALAEDAGAIADVGWPSYAADRGFANQNDTVVTVQSVVAISRPIYSGGATAEEHLATIAKHCADTMGTWAYLGIRFKSWHPLLVLSPIIASVLANGGYGKPEVRHYLYKNANIEAGALERQAFEVGSTDFNLQRLVEAKEISPIYFESTDPTRLVPMFFEEDSIQIVIAGDGSRNQSKVYINNHEQGPPVSRVAELPRNWDRLVAALGKPRLH